jgi:hypothetical protein
MSRPLTIPLLSVLVAFSVTFTLAQEKKQSEPPKPAKSISEELLWWWNSFGSKLIITAEEFPEDKYNFKAQQDERTFGGNLLHLTSASYYMINANKGSTVGYIGNDDSLQKKFSTKADIIKYLKQSITDGAELIKLQGDSGFTREFQFPWGNFMAHGWFGWAGIIEHSGEHYGQLVVYYRLNGLVPPASRPK